jgi:hypothetical protein
VYGPVRTVVWQGSAGDRRPYADQTGFKEVIKAKRRGTWLGRRFYFEMQAKQVRMQHYAR